MDPDDIQSERTETPFSVALAAVDRELCNGRQFYMILAGQTWCIFYYGETRVH